MDNKEGNYDLILLGGKVVLPNLRIEKLDIGIINSKIVILGDLSKKSAKKILKINGLLVLPGAIDSQVHFREPGLTHKEDIFYGTRGAVLGGTTSIFEMPNTNPPTTNKDELKKKFELGNKNGFCNFSFFVGATKENIDELNELEKTSGCCGVKIFMGSSTGDLLVEDDENIIKILKKVNKMVAIHSEDEYRLRERKEMFSNKEIKVFDHPVLRDVTSAVKSTKRLLNSARIANKKIHILHLSTVDEVTLLESNKDIASCEVTPQHLFFSSPDCYKKLGTFAQMNPPIRDKVHTDGLWDGLSRGVIDVIGSDHAPHTIEEKRQKYPSSPSGMTGVQTLLPIMLNFVNQGKLSIFDLVRMVCKNPCKIYGVADKGEIRIGYDADLTIVDMKKKFKISNEWIQSKSKWTPYDNFTVQGIPVFTIINGQIVVSEQEIISQPVGKKINFNP